MYCDSNIARSIAKTCGNPCIELTVLRADRIEASKFDELNRSMCQTLHAARQVRDLGATSLVRFRLSKSGSGIGQEHISESQAFFGARIGTECKFCHSSIDEASLDVVLVFEVRTASLVFCVFWEFLGFHWFCKHFELCTRCIKSVGWCKGGMPEGQP